MFGDNDEPFDTDLWLEREEEIYLDRLAGDEPRITMVGDDALIYEEY